MQTTTIVEEVVTQTVTDESGNVISGPVVIDTNTTQSTSQYTSTSEPQSKATSSVSISTTMSSDTYTTEREVSEVVVSTTTEEVSVDGTTEVASSEGSVSSANQNNSSVIISNPNISTFDESSASYADETSDSDYDENITSETIVVNDLLSSSDETTGGTASTDISDIVGDYTIEIRKNQTVVIDDILSSKDITGARLSSATVLDERIAAIGGAGGSYATGYNITASEERRTKFFANVNGNFSIFNLEVYGEEETQTAVPMVVSNENFTLALKNDGTVWGWGLVGDNQLANLKVSGDVQNTPYQIQIKENGVLSNLTDIKQIAVGSGHALAVTNEGRVYAWGLNRNGQLATGYKYNGTNPEYVLTSAGTPLENIKYAAAGNYSSYAITESGEVYAWGFNYYGQLGLGVSGGEEDVSGGYTSDVLYATKIESDADGAAFDGIIKISASNSHMLALKYDGTLYASGSNKDGLLYSSSSDSVISSPKKYTSLSLDGTIVDIAVGGGTSSTGSFGEEGTQEIRFHSLILTNSRSVYAWGSNAENTLGIDNAYEDLTTPTQITGLQKIVSISASRYNSAAVSMSGNVYAWGRNDEGESGSTSVTGTTTSSPVLVMAGESSDTEDYLTSVLSVAIGANHMSALREDGTVYSWGSVMLGQLGNGENGEAIGSHNLPVRTGDDESNSLSMEYVITVYSETGDVIAIYEDNDSIPDVITITDSQNVKIKISEIKKYYKTGFNLIKSDEKLDI
ncbi:MAG: hypothetical protein LIO59_01940, partial [Oscillospiraceae bacterium]|nr:hypothetical protein [Oscillospiraceae bacterium]